MSTAEATNGGWFNQFQLASARVPFRVKVAFVWIVIALVLLVVFELANFQAGWMWDHFRYVAAGMKFTLALAVAAIALACVMALIGSLCRLSRNPVLYGVSGFYVSFFRGTPLIVQLFLIYLALPQIGIGSGNETLADLLTLTAFKAGVIGLGLNYGAYMTEIFRAGIQSVAHGQWEAAEALAMKHSQAMRRVILPQAFRVIIPPTGNEFIAMIKDTALVSFLGVAAANAEIFRRANLAGKKDFHNLEAYLLAALLYWAITIVFSYFQSRLEKRLSAGYTRTAAKPLKTLGAQAGVTMVAPVDVPPSSARPHGSGGMH